MALPQFVKRLLTSFNSTLPTKIDLPGHLNVCYTGFGRSAQMLETAQDSTRNPDHPNNLDRLDILPGSRTPLQRFGGDFGLTRCCLNSQTSRR